MYPQTFFSVLITAFLILYLYFTYILFNTAIRVIIVSSFIIVVSAYGAVLLMSQSFRVKTTKRAFYGTELMLLFLFTAIFFVFRVIATTVVDLSMTSLFDHDLYTSISFIFTIFQHLVFFMGMATATLRKKNDLLKMEKERFQYLFSFLSDTAKHLNIEALYKRISEILVKTLHIDSGGIFLLDEDRQGLTLTYPINYLNIDASSVQHMERGNGLIWQAIEEDKVVAIDVKGYPENPFHKEMNEKGIRYIAVAPIKSVDGIIGGITALFTSKERYMMMKKDLFYYLGEQIGLVLHNAMMYGEASSLAHTDMLTGLYTRRKFFEILSIEAKRIKRYPRSFCIAMADIDFFKQVNDSAGHDCGDRLLQLAADLFQRECRDTDYVCRWGGEEFMFLFLDTDLDSASVITERIRIAFENSSCQCVGSGRRTISIGLTQSDPEVSLNQLIKRADELLYSAKSRGRNRVVPGLCQVGS